MTSRIKKPSSPGTDDQRYLNLTKQIVLSHLRDIDCQVFLYGSRACGKAGWGSDIDIGILGAQPLEKKLLADIRHSLEESVVPYHVDLTDFAVVKDDTFRQQALKETVKWK